MRLAMIAAVVVAMGLATPALAQDATAAHRLELAERLIELSSGDGFEKVFEQQIESQLAALGDARTPEANWMRVNIPRLVLQAMNRMMPELAALYADVFTEAELEAQLALYESPVGRSIANKAVGMSVRLQNILTVAMADYFDEFSSKYCAEFDCSGGGIAKSRTR